MIQKLTIVLVIFLCSCHNEEGPVPVNVIPSRIQPFVDQFVWEAEKRNVFVDVSRLNFRFERNIPNGNSPGTVVGSCTRFSNQRLIQLDTLNSLWLLSGKLGREEIIFHELGHCLLDRPHKDDKFRSGDFASIMRTIGLLQYGDLNNFTTLFTGPVGLKAHRRDYYVDELFEQSVSTPCWSDSTVSSPFPLTVFDNDFIKNNEIRNLWLDPEDNLWLFGNEKCLVHSNGTFENALPSMKITAMNNDSKGNLWIAAVGEDGAVIGTYAHSSGTFDSRYSADSIPGEFPIIERVFVDDLDRIWISDFNGNVYVNIGNGFELVMFSNQVRVFKMKQGPNHTVYMLKGAQLHIFEDPQTHTVLTSDNSDLITDFFWDLEVDRNGVAWLLPSGASSYFLQLTPDLQVSKLDFYDISLAELRVNSIEKDSFGDIWAATSNGIKKWEGASFSDYCKYNTGVNILTFNRIVVGAEGKIWTLGKDLTDLQQRLMLSEPGL